MKSHTALIVDDERIARRELAYLLREHPEVEIVGEAASVDEAAEMIGRLHPEIIFLDVQMPGASGFDLLERVELDAHVIFVTAYDQFAIRAFEVNAIDYLTKPVRPERLRQAIERCDQRGLTEPPTTTRLSPSDSILLTIDRRSRLVKLASIECILAEGDYTRLIIAGSAAGMVLKPIKEWERILPEKQFCRIQRSAIINCEQAIHFEPTLNGGYEVHMKHLNAPLTMSRRFARRFRAQFAV